MNSQIRNFYRKQYIDKILFDYFLVTLLVTLVNIDYNEKLLSL